MNGADFRQREELRAVLQRIAKALERIADSLEADQHGRAPEPLSRRAAPPKP